MDLYQLLKVYKLQRVLLEIEKITQFLRLTLKRYHKNINNMIMDMLICNSINVLHFKKIKYFLMH